MKNHEALAATLQAMGFPRPKCEHIFHDSRKWRFDLAWPDQKVAVEIQGGVRSGGRHVRMSGYEADCEKLAEAVLLGWRVFWMPSSWFTSGLAYAILERAMRT